VAPFVAKKKQPCKKVISKKKKRGRWKNNKNSKDCDVEALIALCEGDEAEICQECKKKKRLKF
jgi:hypothetical protein